MTKKDKLIQKAIKLRLDAYYHGSTAQLVKAERKAALLEVEANKL